jgi:hypothetical protein
MFLLGSSSCRGDFPSKPVGLQHGEFSQESNFSGINRPIVSILFLLRGTSENHVRNLNALNFESKHVAVASKIEMTLLEGSPYFVGL